MKFAIDIKKIYSNKQILPDYRETDLCLTRTLLFIFNFCALDFKACFLRDRKYVAMRKLVVMETEFTYKIITKSVLMLNCRNAFIG